MAAAEELPHDLVFVDLETTGGNATCDRITEVGLIRIRGGELIEEWSSLVNPEVRIPPYIESFTGISNEMVAGAPRFGELAPLLREKLGGAVFVAHNARFDYSFLRSEFLKAGGEFSAQVLCTVKLSRRLFPEFARHNLDAVMERNGLTCSARHRALGDARVLFDFWFKLKGEVPQAQLAAVVHALLSAQTLPAYLPAGLADELPEGAGVYRFFDADNTLLYVGRSQSLRARVCRHFSAGDGGSPDHPLAALVRRIDWRETAGELGAMLLEAHWIKTGRPLFNRRIKSQSQAHTLRAVAAIPAVAAVATVPAVAALATVADVPAILAVAGAALQVRPVSIDGLDLAQLMQCFGVFHSEKDARKAFGDIAAAHQLCRAVLGLEEGAGSCLAYQLGQCKGACVGKEPLVLHNMRLQLALASLKLKTWPFPGRIAVRERQPRAAIAEFNHGTDLHVLDRWAYLGTARNEEELDALRIQDSSAAFDVDVYRILIRYFANNPQPAWIDLEPSRQAAMRG